MEEREEERKSRGRERMNEEGRIGKDGIVKKTWGEREEREKEERGKEDREGQREGRERRNEEKEG